MTHYEKQAWMDYLEERIMADEMAQMELHLYRCDVCLSIYMGCMEQSASLLPMMKIDTQSFVDSIILRTIRTKIPWYRSTVFHYGIAAAATLILVATGFFHGLSQELDAVGFSRGISSIHDVKAPSSLQQDQQPISDQLLNKTLTWFDTWQNDKDKGGSRP
ncbi:hypothetical protein [Paenibacillus sp. SI8]|uniref:hypothetical protein n=1 Tax=unclassified Paenibacillus TaxID=185978 RepID=UPI003466949D